MAVEVSIRRAIQIVWWLGLLVALVATPAILKEVTLVLRALRDIDNLARLTLDAARGIGANVAAISKLEGVNEPIERLARATGELDLAATELGVTLEELAPRSAARGGSE